MNTSLSSIPGVESLIGCSIAEVERDLILQTLIHCLGNRTRAAKLLRISVRTMRNKINEYASEGLYVPMPGRNVGE
jgi:two-component system response regulator FlrC